MAVLNCPRCGTPWTPEDVYCRSCGQFVSAETAVAAVPPAPAEATPAPAPPEATAPAAGPAPAEVPELLFPWGPHRPADGESLTLGRAFPPFAQQLAAYPNVGRVHARVVAAGGVLLVTDLKSLNRTFIDGVPLPAEAPSELRPGQVLRLGASLEVLVR
ncbi:MAG: hypothetical protein BGO11_07460 [Solirubrobacterales bacterium 70-9]|mgnify:CR=1 FL=1|nr:MAG: hypothetical protein BGO11_07460 [Solirubrobacterales bacterium 70-9]